MPYMVSYDQNDTVVTVKILESLSLINLYKARDEAFSICQDKNCSKLFFDWREFLTEAGSIMDYFNFGESFTEKSLKVSIAHLLPLQKKSREDVIFISTVMANRGLVVGEFEHIDSARKWLLNKT